MELSSSAAWERIESAVRTETLANGLEIVVAPFGTAPVATVAVLYRVGSRDEETGATGSAHLLEHMLFKGTPKNNPASGRSFADMMLEAGASFNATTGYDRTLYFQTLPSEYAAFALELEADRMRSAFIADEDRRFEMTVVRNEFERAKSRPATVLGMELIATAYREHPYHHPPIGWQSDVEAVSTDRLRDMYQTFYRPDNAVLFLTGAIDEGIVEAARRAFSAIERPPGRIPEVYTSEPAQLGRREVTVRWRGETRLLRMAYRIPGPLGQQRVLSRAELVERAAMPGALDEIAAFAVLDSVLTDGATSRLSRRLIDERLCASAGADTWVKRDPGMFSLGATLIAGVEPARVLEIVDAELRDLAERGPTEAEVERAKRLYSAHVAFRTESSNAIAQTLAEAESCGSWRLDANLSRAVSAVTPDAVRAVVAEYVNDDVRTLGHLEAGEPRTYSLPLTPLAESIQPPIVDAAPLPKPASVSIIRFADRIAHGRVRERMTWNAVEEAQSAVIEIRLRIEAGPNYCERPLLAGVGAAMLAAGTRKRNRIEVDRALAEAGASRRYATDDRNYQYDGRALRIGGSTVREGFATLLSTLTEELTEPAFATEELERVRIGFITQARAARTNAPGRANQALSRLLYERHDVNYAPSIEEAIEALEAIDTAELRQWYERVMCGGSVAISVAGGFGGAGALETALRDAFEGTPLASRAAAPLVRIDAASPAAERNETVEVGGQRNVEIRLGRATSLTRVSEDWTAATVANAILGASSLTGRLGRRLRIEEGLTYAINSTFTSGAFEGSPWRVMLGASPDNVERAIVSVREVMARYAEAGPTEREIEAARNAIAGSTILATSTCDGIARTLGRIAAYDLGDDYVDTQRERLHDVNRADIEAAIERYLLPDELAVVRAGPLVAAQIS